MYIGIGEEEKSVLLATLSNGQGSSSKQANKNRWIQKRRRARTLRDIVHVLQSVGGTLEGGKGLELNHLAKLCEISGGLADVSELGANLLRL
jgi:hypothetical protein